MADSVLEISISSHMNPLTIVLPDGKPPRVCVDARKLNRYTLPDSARALPDEKAPRVCVDARKLNRYTLPDSARVLPIPEFLKQFLGSIFITTIDLSLAFM